MLKLTRYLFRISILLFLAGGLSCYVGGSGLVRFFVHPVIEGRPTVVQLLRYLILPHFFLLVGLGFLIFGVILFCKAILFHRNHCS